MIVFCVSDLMFRSRIRETLKDSIKHEFVKSAEGFDKLLINLDINSIEKVIIDLNLSKSLDLITYIKSKYPSLNITSYGSHMNIELLENAKKLGCDSVVANSSFVKWLESLRSDTSKEQVGIISLAGIVFTAIFASALWYAFQIIPVYYKYYELENAFRSISRVANQYNDKILRQRLLAQMKDIGVPGNINDVHMERLPNAIRVIYSYYDSIEFSLGDNTWTLQEFHFDLDVAEETVL